MKNCSRHSLAEWFIRCFFFSPHNIHLFNVQQWSRERDKMKIEVESLLFIIKELCVLILTSWKMKNGEEQKVWKFQHSSLSADEETKNERGKQLNSSQVFQYKFDAIRVELIKIVMFWWMETVFQFSFFNKLAIALCAIDFPHRSPFPFLFILLSGIEIMKPENPENVFRGPFVIHLCL